MLFRIDADTDLEITDALDGGGQFGGVLIAIGARFVITKPCWRIAAQGHDMAHTGIPIGADHFIDFLTRGIDTGQVCGGTQMCLVEDTLDRTVGTLASGTAGAIGDGHKVRIERRQAADRIP